MNKKKKNRRHLVCGPRFHNVTYCTAYGTYCTYRAVNLNKLYSRNKGRIEVNITLSVLIHHVLHSLKVKISISRQTHSNPIHSLSQHAYLLFRHILYLLIFGCSFLIPLQKILLIQLFNKKEIKVQLVLLQK